MYLMCLCVYLIGRTGFYNTQKQTCAGLADLWLVMLQRGKDLQGPASFKDIECMSSRSETLLNHNKAKSAMHGTFFYVA